MSGESFSFSELDVAGEITLPRAETIIAEDGTSICYRKYTSVSPKAVLLFYHGGGAHSIAGYQIIGDKLSNLYNIVVYTPDIRGHGISGGARGDCSSRNRALDDISLLIRDIHKEYPAIPVFIGGHSSGAGLVLNYSSYKKHEDVYGYVFLSPQLGYKAKAERDEIKNPFVRIDLRAFILNSLSAGLLNRHKYAVYFNYPSNLLEKGMINAITIPMSLALTPINPKEQFEKINKPIGLWIGAEDELFNPQKVIRYGLINRRTIKESEIEIIKNEKHLSIITTAYNRIGPWIEKIINQNSHPTTAST